MKAKLSLLLVAKLLTWDKVCGPFVGEITPIDHKSAVACFHAQQSLERVIHKLDLLNADHSDNTQTNVVINHSEK